MLVGDASVMILTGSMKILYKDDNNAEMQTTMTSDICNHGIVWNKETIYMYYDEERYFGARNYFE